MIVRPAVAADLDSIAQVHVQAWDETYHGIVPDEAFESYTLEKRLTQWRGILADPARLVYVLERDGTVCGFGSGGAARPGLPTASEIYAFYLVATAKRQGNGRLLFDRLRMELARDYASLGLWVLVNNLAARRFYEAMGGRAGETKIDRRGDLSFDDIAYLWDDISRPPAHA